MKKIILGALSFVLALSVVANGAVLDTPNTIEKESKTQEEKQERQYVICIDPGHQKRGDNRLEQGSPSGGGQKARVSSGTAGVATKNPEYVINLQASMILKEILEKRGYKVVMTRETHDINISNAERARMGNDCMADMVVRIHCDGLNDSSKSGATVIIPSAKCKDTKPIFDNSKKYGELLRNELKKSGVKVNGVFERGDMTGFNWSKVPVVILEMGFMSNYNEDRMLADENYQRKLMVGVAGALDNYCKDKK
ncbi:MAG: N-acetylmuramoyl-L-alanine amidase [Clostridium sp.]